MRPSVVLTSCAEASLSASAERALNSVERTSRACPMNSFSFTICSSFAARILPSASRSLATRSLARWEAASASFRAPLFPLPGERFEAGARGRLLLRPGERGAGRVQRAAQLADAALEFVAFSFGQGATQQESDQESGQQSRDGEQSQHAIFLFA